MQSLKDEYETVYTMATKVTPTMSDGSAHSGFSDSKVEKYASKMVELTEKIQKIERKKERIDSELGKLKPHQRCIVEAIDLQHTPISLFASKTGRNEATIRHNRNRIIDGMFLQDKT